MSLSQALTSIVSSFAIILALVVQSYLARKFGARNADNIVSEVGEVKALVNGTSVAHEERIDQLTQTIQAAGVTIPPKAPPSPAQTGETP